MAGILYVVATPIGNLKDITLRAIDVLAQVDFIVAESRERALKLLSHLEIRKSVTTINSYNENSRAKSIAAQLGKGKTAALITAAGTPCISDPGDRVVRACYEEGVEIRAIPGPSAAIAALSISGLSPDHFFFYGFLPQRKGKKKKILSEILSTQYPVVFFESPRRIEETLGLVREEVGERLVVLLREMTKLHEEVVRGTAGEVMEIITDSEKRGEYILIVEGRRKPVSL
jgi:16S rRNA (cytidine1402-2'-O)-methyltransferase